MRPEEESRGRVWALQLLLRVEGGRVGSAELSTPDLPPTLVTLTLCTPPVLAGIGSPKKSSPPGTWKCNPFGNQVFEDIAQLLSGPTDLGSDLNPIGLVSL